MLEYASGKVARFGAGLGIYSRSTIIATLSRAQRGEDGESVRESLNQAIVFSRHCPISLAIRTKQFKSYDDKSERFLNRKPPKFMWVPNQAVKFKSILDREYVVSSAKTLVTHYLTRNDDYKS